MRKKYILPYTNLLKEGRQSFSKMLEKVTNDAIDFIGRMAEKRVEGLGIGVDIPVMKEVLSSVSGISPRNMIIFNYNPAAGVVEYLDKKAICKFHIYPVS